MNNQIKLIEVRKFYFMHDGSLTGHPGLIVWKNEPKNLYLAIKFGTSPNKHNFAFKKPLGNNTIKSFVYKRAFLGKRGDFRKAPLEDMVISNGELLELIRIVNFDNPVYSKNINRKDKRFYKWVLKKEKPFYQGQLSEH